MIDENEDVYNEYNLVLLYNFRPTEPPVQPEPASQHHTTISKQAAFSDHHHTTPTATTTATATNTKFGQFLLVY